MADRGAEFSFFQDIHVRIDISISMITYNHQIWQSYLLPQDLTQTRLIKQVLVTSLRQDQVKN